MQCRSGFTCVCVFVNGVGEGLLCLSACLLALSPHRDLQGTGLMACVSQQVLASTDCLLKSPPGLGVCSLLFDLVPSCASPAPAPTTPPQTSFVCPSVLHVASGAYHAPPLFPGAPPDLPFPVAPPGETHAWMRSRLDHSQLTQLTATRS